MSVGMEDPAGYLASKYKYLFRVPGGRWAASLVAASAGVAGALIALQGLPLLQALAYSIIGLAALPLTLSLLSTRLFYGLPLHSTFRRLCQLSLLTNYIFIGALAVGYLLAPLLHAEPAQILSVAVATAAYIRLTITLVIDGDRGLAVASWAMIDPALSSIFLSAALGETIPGPLQLGLTIGATLAVVVAIALGRRGSDGLSSIRLARGLSRLLLEGDAETLERELSPHGKVVDRVTEAFVFRGRSTGRISAIVVLPFHMGPMGLMGSSILNWLVEAAAAEKGITAVALKGCTTHNSDMVTSVDARRVASEIVSGISRLADGWSDGAGALAGVRVGSAEGLVLELAGRRLAVVSLHPAPMEDIPEEVASYADEHNVTLIDPHNSFSPIYKRIGARELSDILALVDQLGGATTLSQGRLRVAVARSGHGVRDQLRGIGPCGYALVALMVDGLKTALCVIDGNNAMPWVRGEVRRCLTERGWNAVELLTTDTHAVNGAFLGGRGYFCVGERVSRDEIVGVFNELARVAEESAEEADAAYIRIKHVGVALFTEELFIRLARRVRRHGTIYLSGMIGAAILALVASTIL